MHGLNEVWGKHGNCIRLAQRNGDPPVISDLIFSDGYQTFSIEVKKISRRTVNTHGKQKQLWLNYRASFTTAKSKNVEFPYQLERQVIYSNRMGWIPLVLLFVINGPGRKSEKYLFDSEELLLRKNAGEKALSSYDFNLLHKEEIYDHIFRPDIIEKKVVTKGIEI